MAKQPFVGAVSKFSIFIILQNQYLCKQLINIEVNSVWHPVVALALASGYITLGQTNFLYTYRKHIISDRGHTLLAIEGMYHRLDF